MAYFMWVVNMSCVCNAKSIDIGDVSSRKFHRINNSKFINLDLYLGVEKYVNNLYDEAYNNCDGSLFIIPMHTHTTFNLKKTLLLVFL